MTDPLLFAGTHKDAVIALLNGGRTEHELMAYANWNSGRKLNHETAQVIRWRWRFGEPTKAIAADYGINASTVSQIINYVTHRDIVLYERTGS